MCAELARLASLMAGAGEQGVAVLGHVSPVFRTISWVRIEWAS